MASTVTVSVDVQVQSGPKVSYSLVEQVDAYGLTEVVIPKNTTSKEIPIIPAAPGDIRLLLITADVYGTISYVPKDGTAAGAKVIALNAPQLLIGGSIGMLEKVPHVLVFTTTPAQDVKVQILVGRKI